ncbi:acyl-CoA-binding protein [Chitinophaga sedimenti]|uniref:acyl-CoA-binding protein n=1 Tax=Chitinophaga sedimenti TaxID=2033606 RepID=UPI0020031DF1|nr:acyl-CoA-binding protein [Chitinophaga sedimenti]MCK7555084.1 acyl-CoA-binding protein [Chitinophaga sedimenti]
MELQEQFEAAVAASKTLAEKPDNDTLLQIYSLYKQATEGDVNVEAPANPFDFVARAKHDAWSGLKGKDKTAAMQEYVALIDRLRGKS